MTASPRILASIAGAAELNVATQHSDQVPRSPASLARSFRRYALVLALCGAAAAQGAALRVTVEGLDDELANAAYTSLSLNQYVDRDVTAAQVRRLFARGEGEISEALEPYGYYDARIQANLEAAEDTFHAVYTVDPGQPVIVRESVVRVAGEGGDAAPVRAAVAAMEPKEGERLDHAKYEASKAQIENALFS